MPLDLQFWSDQPEYTLQNAAFLCCNREPGEANKTDWPRIQAMERRLLTEVPFRDTSRTERSHNNWLGVDQDISHPGEKLFKREDLRAWAEKNGLRPKFLFPEEQNKNNISKGQEGKPSRDRDNILRMLGLMARAVIDKNSPKYGNQGSPNISQLAEIITRV